MDQLALTKIIRPAVALARDYASRVQQLRTSEKSPGDFVSEADEAIEDLLRRSIIERFGDVPVLGEEGGGSLGEMASGWAIDPIDGTSNFLRGLPMWGISVGLLEDGVSVAGALALPILDLVLVVEPGAPLTVNGQSFVRPGGTPGGRLVALGENNHEGGAQTDARAERLREQGCAVVRYRSAVFSLAQAALGGLDGYVEHGCCLWDLAGGAAICRAAGLDVAVAPLGHGRFSVEAMAPAPVNHPVR